MKSKETGVTMKNKFLKVVFVILILLTSFLCGCMSEGQDGQESTAPSQSEQAQPSDTSEKAPEAEGSVYFKVTENGDTYSYELYNKDGSVAEEIDGCIAEPVISMTDTGLVRVTVGRETYYYDLEKCVFSETFTDAFCENGTLLARADGESIVICDIFDDEGFYKELNGFTYDLSEKEDTPFLSCEFIDGGGSVRVVYLSGDRCEERLECFNITNGTRFVTVADWKNQKELISGDEKSGVESFLYSYMGTVDYNTGFEFTYEISGALEINGTRFFHCECFYVMEGEGGEEELVHAAEFVLSENRDERYDCRESNGELIVYTENNMI